MVRVGTPSAVARPEWYDRNPIDATLAYQGLAIGPHSITLRGSYTVPAGKKAFLESLYLLVYRVTAATTVGSCMARVDYTPAGGTTKVFCLVIFTNNTADFNVDHILGNCGCMRAGDQLAIYTADGSTGGTVSYYETIKVTEFDA